MKKIVPFTKDLMFKTKIEEVTSISLDNNLTLKDDLVSGEFIITGTYKMMDDSQIEEKFNFNIPVDISIDNKYETSNCQISIDDFNYEIINEETLKVNISVMLDDLDIKNTEVEKLELSVDTKDDIEIVDDILDVDEIKNDEQDILLKKDNNMEKLTFEDELVEKIDNKDEYSIYRVYTYKEDDTIDLILDKFNITRDLLSDYNDLDNLKIGSKLIIPSVDE